jgi:hypothetical protein
MKPEAKNDCTGGGQQQFNWPTEASQFAIMS